MTSAMLDKHFVPLLKQQIMGLAEDFWKDGDENLFGIGLKKAKKNQAFVEPVYAKREPVKSSSPELWHAVPGEISEKMWGEGFVTPGGHVINSLLIKPLGLTKEMSVLDISAGLGGYMRRAAEETGAYVTGLEPDAKLAERGMQLSIKAGKAKRAPITHYDSANLVLDRTFDSVVARETFYRLPDRPNFFTTIAEHTKSQAQIAFTDYILDKEHREKPEVLAWKEKEKLANPLSLVEMAEAWAKVGFRLRVHEDLTDFYKTEVLVGMKRLMEFLASGIRPDKETAESVLRRIETWQYRLKAMDVGMKFYRFYGTKQ
jgi:cyclopropane fatty-acyl-phospholipid synthase-like methyltransferase